MRQPARSARKRYARQHFSSAHAAALTATPVLGGHGSGLSGRGRVAAGVPARGKRFPWALSGFICTQPSRIARNLRQVNFPLDGLTFLGHISTSPPIKVPQAPERPSQRSSDPPRRQPSADKITELRKKEKARAKPQAQVRSGAQSISRLDYADADSDPSARRLMRGLFLDSLGWQAGHEASVHALLSRHNQADPTACAGDDDESDDESAKQHAWACVVDGLN